MLNLDERLVAELDCFTKAGFDPERVAASARKRVLSRLLRQELSNPSPEITRHFAKQFTTTRLSADELRYYAGLLSEAWRELVEPPEIVPPPPPPPPPPPDSEFVPVFGYGHDGAPIRSTLATEKCTKWTDHFRPSNTLQWRVDLAKECGGHGHTFRRSKIPADEEHILTDSRSGM